MNKEKLKEKVSSKIDNDKAIKFLGSLVRLPSENGQPTLAQELILQKMEELGLNIDKFSGNTAGVEDYADYCPLNEGEKVDERAYNLVGIKSGKGQGKSLMLFAHIDTETCESADIASVYDLKRVNNRLYGHGIADDKSGMATIMLAVEAVLKETDLDGDLIVMSVLGKRGGSAGTLSAIAKGYKADGGIYLHPAETGHGYTEVKIYSMGTVDFSVTIKGSEGRENDELDNSEVNAIKKGSMVVEAMSDWDKARRERILFTEGTYAGTPKTKLNISTAEAGIKVGRDPMTYTIKSRLYFGEEETIYSVLEELKDYFHKRFAGDDWLSVNPPEIEILNLRATPAMVSKDSDIVRTIEKNISSVNGVESFIYQYHGASDIRHPIVYGNTPTAGIGPLCGGLYGADWTEWVDEKEFVDGIKMLASIIIDWCLTDK
ncbi:MAG: M20/M25/M40 family metallo-hydrolase [Eubacteriales bacterium]|nr:M20/M25/M40 family metallo-hydrolase [Eubacteriales bacterium]